MFIREKRGVKVEKLKSLFYTENVSSRPPAGKGWLYMYRGSTPTIRFTTPLKANEVATLSVVFTDESGAILSQKTQSDATIGDYEISFTLSQTETLGFPDGGTVETQLRIKDTSGVAYVSNIVKIDTGRVLKTGVI